MSNEPTTEELLTETRLMLHAEKCRRESAEHQVAVLGAEKKRLEYLVAFNQQTHANEKADLQKEIEFLERQVDELLGED